jgi:ribulose-phosphate 3-epimerase
MGNNNIKISASILSANFLNLGDDIRKIESAGADSLHLDVMDNHLAPSLSFGPPIIKPVRSITNLPLDAHLMIDAPWMFFDAYINCGVEEICFHIEAYDKTPVNHSNITAESRTATNIDYAKLEKDIYYLKTNDIKPGITINPNTNYDVLLPILSQVDSVLVMSVHPGFSGQSFIVSSTQKVGDIRNHFSGDIKVDGGVNNTNAKLLTGAGATTLISASYLFGAPDYKAAIDSLR